MQEHPSPPCLRLWCPAVSNYSNHRSSTISCHSQMGIQAAVLVFQRDHVSRGRSWLQLTGWWWLHNLVESLTHKLLRSPWHDKWRLAMHVCVCVRVWRTTSSVPALLYTFLRQGWFHRNLFVWPMLCLSEKPDPRHPSQAREETEQIRPCCPSVRLDWAEMRIVCCILKKSRCWETYADMLFI